MIIFLIPFHIENFYFIIGGLLFIVLLLIRIIVELKTLFDLFVLHCQFVINYFNMICVSRCVFIHNNLILCKEIFNSVCIHRMKCLDIFV